MMLPRDLNLQKISSLLSSSTYFVDAAATWKYSEDSESQTDCVTCLSRTFSLQTSAVSRKLQSNKTFKLTEIQRLIHTLQVLTQKIGSMRRDSLLPDDVLEIVWNNALSDIIHQNLLASSTVALDSSMPSSLVHAQGSSTSLSRPALDQSGITERIRQILNLCHVCHRCRSMMEHSLGKICISRSESGESYPNPFTSSISQLPVLWPLIESLSTLRTVFDSGSLQLALAASAIVPFERTTAGYNPEFFVSLMRSNELIRLIPLNRIYLLYSRLIFNIRWQLLSVHHSIPITEDYFEQLTEDGKLSGWHRSFFDRSICELGLVHFVSQLGKVSHYILPKKQ